MAEQSIKTADQTDLQTGDDATPAKRPRSNKGADTRRQLLAAAENCLREEGYNAFSTRQVAQAAGNVPLSQIHYHFGSKQGLVLAVFEDLNERLLHRQTEMFASDLPLWRQWERACDYLEDDLESGYVRVLNELATVGWSNTDIGDAVRKAVSGWQELITDVAKRAGERYGGFGPLAPEDVAALISCVFFGAEMNILSGHESQQVPVRRSLRRFGDLIRQFEETMNQGA